MGEIMLYQTMPSPAGEVLIVEDAGAIVRLEFKCAPPQGAQRGENPLLQKACAQLSEYFAGRRRTFDLPVRMQGTSFQMAVWQALCEIPYGETRSYADIARRIGRPGACRAVGGANHVNPVCILVPCHRVIGASGALVGYGGGLDVKQILLDIERKNMIGAE